jgi:hypothetical protein
VRLAALVALLFTCGCVRFGYHAYRGASEPDAAVAPSDAAVEEVTDASVVDAAVGVPAVLCPDRSDALFCDGFEDLKSRWSYEIAMNGTAARTTTRFHSGSASLLATTGAAAPNTAARYAIKAFNHQKSGEIWARSFYYVPSSSVADPYFSTTVVAELEPPYFGFSLLVLPSRVAIGVGDKRYQGTLAFPRDRWTCVELHVSVAATGGMFEAYLDGALAARSPAIDTLPDQGYTTLDVGIHYTDPKQGPVEVYVDDVVASNTRPGCE